MNTFFSKLPIRYSWHVVVIVVLLVQLACIGYLAYTIRNLDRRTLQQSTVQMIQSRAAESAATQVRPTVAPADRLIYLTDLGISLPLNETTRSLVYSTSQSYTGANGYSDEENISTVKLANNTATEMQRISCATAVRVKFEAKSNPYNPHEKNVATALLADGRTLQAYAFTHPDCTAVFQRSGVDSVAIGEAFKDAKSY